MRTPTLSLSIAIVSSLFVFAVPALATTGCNAEGWDLGFSDVRGCTSSFPAIQYMKEKQIVQGYPDGTFRPDATLNRAEFVKILIASRFANEQIAEGLKQERRAHLEDVDGAAWYAKYVQFARYKGFIDGYADGTFRPNAQINYAEAAKIVANTFGLPKEETMHESEPWYLPYTNAVLQKHIVPPTVYKFSKLLTRGEFAEMLYRLETGSASLDWFASLQDGDTVQSDTVPQTLPGVSFSYPGAKFTMQSGEFMLRDIFAERGSRMIPAKRLSYVHTDEEEMWCDGMSGMVELCRPVYSQLDISIGIADRPLTYMRMGLHSAYDDYPKEVVVDGRKGISLYDGIECEGYEHTFVPMDATRTLVIWRTVDCNPHPEGYLSSDEQEALFRAFLDTIDIASPVAVQSAPTMDVSILLCPQRTDEQVPLSPPDIKVMRTVPKSSSVADMTLKALIHLSWDSERRAGECPGMAWMRNHYRSVTIANGEATVKLDATFDAIFHNVDTNKEEYKISAQRAITANLKQFPTVQTVRYVVQP